MGGFFYIKKNLINKLRNKASKKPKQKTKTKKSATIRDAKHPQNQHP